MTYLTWRRECVLSAIDRLVEESTRNGGLHQDGGKAFNGMVNQLSRSMPPEEILAATADLLTDHRPDRSPQRVQVLKSIDACLPVTLERQGLNRRIELERPLLEAHALRCSEDSLLLWDPVRSNRLEEVAIHTLLARYPCSGHGSRWSTDGFLALQEARQLQCRRTAMALEIAREDPTSCPAIGTVILVVPQAAATTLWFRPVVMAMPQEVRDAFAELAAGEHGPACPLPRSSSEPAAPLLPPTCVRPR